jgi:hypothetical protein
MDQPRKHIAAMISGLDVAYDLSGGHTAPRAPHA